jgi:hypothetical protein
MATPSFNVLNAIASALHTTVKARREEQLLSTSGSASRTPTCTSSSAVLSSASRPRIGASL